MTTVTATKARANFYSLIDQTSKSHKPVVITGKRTNAILVSQEDWDSIQETLYLVSIPGMRDSIVEGMKTPTKKLSSKLEW